MMAGSAGAGTLLAWQNRDTVVHVHVGGLVWTGHLYGVLAVGALLACWFLLGASFIRCRVAESRRARAEERRPAATVEQGPERPPQGWAVRPKVSAW